MDGIFPILVIIGIVNAIFKWAKKQQASANRDNHGAAPEKPWQRMLGDLTQTIEESMSGKQPAKTAQPAQVYKTLKAPALREGMGSGEGAAMPGSMANQQAPYIAGGEGAASPYSLSSASTSKPQELLPRLQSSLSGTAESASFTAKTADTRLVLEPVQNMYPALSLAINRDTLMQAVVMHEILTRPQDRRRRWRPR